MKFVILIFLMMQFSFANSNDLTHRPKSFTFSKTNLAAFVDFTEASYKITYDLSQKRAYAKAIMTFEMIEEGFPIFDSVEAPTSIILDGQKVSATEISTPNNESKVRVINAKVSRGSHSLEIDLPLKELVKFDASGVRSAFWTTDLEDRNYLEAYLPANYEFDQVKMTFSVNFIGAKNKQLIYTNGIVKEMGNGSFEIAYPSYYTSSSLFFHTVPSDAVSELRFSLKSIDGREIPAVVYKVKNEWGDDSSLKTLRSDVIRIFQELESDYGAFLHSSITVFNAGSGGMEYCGATMTSRSALGHELFHSYFARGMMPANGNSGWLDEALASWRDEGYSTITTLSGSTGMSSHPYYTRQTDRNAYGFGEKFMSYLDGLVKSKGGLKQFMRHVIDKRSLSPLFVEEFSKEISQFYGLDLEKEFKKYTYGGKSPKASSFVSEKTHHQKMTRKELFNLL